MGDQAPQRDARSLREVLVGLSRVEQHKAAARWAVANGRAIDMFGAFYSNGQILLWDMKPKNVLVTADNGIVVIDAEIDKL